MCKRKYRIFYKLKDAPTPKAFKKWYKEFQTEGHTEGAKVGRKPIQADLVNAVRDHFEISPRSSVRQAARELNMACSSEYKTLRTTLKLYP